MDHTNIFDVDSDSVDMLMEKIKESKRHNIVTLFFPGNEFKPVTPTGRDELRKVELSQYSDVVAIPLCVAPYPDDIREQPLCMFLATSIYHRLDTMYDKVNIMGVSSGGFFATMAAHLTAANTLILIAPVLSPVDLPKGSEKLRQEWKHQYCYFGTEARMNDITQFHLNRRFPPSTIIVMSYEDESAPKDVAFPLWATPTIVLIQKGATHSDLCTCLTPRHSSIIKTECTKLYS